MSSRLQIVALLTLLLAVAGAQAAFHLPYQAAPPRPGCGRTPGGYCRPEYPEVAERLDPETLDWLVRTYPVLGWQEMDPRVWRPKPVPGADRVDGFRYDTGRRNLEVEAVFHFGPRGGNGTLIEEMLPLDGGRLLTVNRASRNLSVINTSKPDVDAVIPVPRGLRSLEINLSSQELYLVERAASGMLVWSLKDYRVTDTLFVNFSPGAALLSRDGRWLYLTDEVGGYLVRLDLTRPADGPSRLAVTLAAPWLLAEDRESGIVFLAGQKDGRVLLCEPEGFTRLSREFALGAPLLAWCAPSDGQALFLAAGDCERSAVYSLSTGNGTASLTKLADLGGAVTALGTDPKGEKLCALSGQELYGLNPAAYSTPSHRSLPAPPQRVMPLGSKVYVSAGLDWLLVLDESLQGRIDQVQVEFGPGPLLARDGALWVANGLSSSITVLDQGKLEEKFSVLVGVLLGRMVQHGRKVVVNNLFRGNVMVLNPENYIIEDIVAAGGSLDFSAVANRVTMLDDSLAVGMDYPPSRLSVSATLDLPRGVRLFARLGDSQSYLVADQDRSVEMVDLSRRFRFGGVPLPAESKGVFTWDGAAWVLSAYDLYRFGVGETLGLDRSWPLRPFKFHPPYVAADYVSGGGGSQVHVMYNKQLLDLTSTPGQIGVIRDDPDTSYCWFGTTQNALVFDRRDNRSSAVVPVDGTARDIYLPPGSLNGYICGEGSLTVADRRNFFRQNEIALDGDFVYVSGEELYLLDHADRSLLYVVDGYRAMVYQRLRLPVTPTDAASDGERLYLLGGAEGALAIYSNFPATERLPRSTDRNVWDSEADRRCGEHR